MAWDGGGEKASHGTKTKLSYIIKTYYANCLTRSSTCWLWHVLATSGLAEHGRCQHWQQAAMKVLPAPMGPNESQTTVRWWIRQLQAKANASGAASLGTWVGAGSLQATPRNHTCAQNLCTRLLVSMHPPPFSTFFSVIILCIYISISNILSIPSYLVLFIYHFFL